jgi:ribonucleoside-diphosphate reductase alpha subunit
MQVIKRDGSKADVNFQKIVARIQHLCSGTDINGVRYGEPLVNLDPIKLTMKVIGYIKNNITTRELDEHAAESAVQMGFENYEYAQLAARLLVSNLHKNTIDSFSITMKKLYEYKDERGQPSPLISRDLYKFVEKHAKRIDNEIDYLRDYRVDYTGWKVLERAYLTKYQSGNYRVQERPAHAYMRVALGIWGPCSSVAINSVRKDGKVMDTEEMLQLAFETYHMMSQGYFIHATPTLFNAGTPHPQLSSCFLLPIPDNLKGIYKALSDCALISKDAGGIGAHLTEVRPAGSYIHGTNGRSNGILPMLKVFSDTAKYVDQCFTPDTLLYTPKGPVPIGLMQVGDSVITHTGGVQKVERVLRHEVKTEVFRINIKYSIDPIVVTGEHQVLVLRDQVKGLNLEMEGENVIRNRLENGYAKPEWLDVKDLRVGDYVCFPGLDKSCERDIPEYTLEDLKRYGRSLLLEQGQNKGDKRIDPQMLFLPQEKCAAILQGLFESLGCKESDPVHQLDSARRLVADHSKEFLESVRFLQWRCNNSIVYCCAQTGDDLLVKLGLSFTQVTCVATEQFEGELYDLEVQNDHTYLTANLGIVHNGGGKRMGSFAMYIEPWHPEILEFLQAKLGTGHEEMRARHLFYALWTPDIFMRRVNAALEEEKKAAEEKRPKRAVMWSTFCPHECPGLASVWGAQFDQLYEKYESEGRARSQIDIMKIWHQMLDAQKETGNPYLLYKDASNAKSNQQNLGTITGSNLCTEIIEYTDTKEYATCNLASISLPRHVKENVKGELEVDYEAIANSASILTRNLNRVIDINSYSVPETKVSNERHRPIGLGVQGLADLFHILRVPFDSVEAGQINRDIFEAIYYGALRASHEQAVIYGPYSTFVGSPASKGILQFDMWNYKPSSMRWDWEGLRAAIVKDGLRNSLLVAPMPTASTSQILGNTECFEPVSYNLFVKRLLAGEFTVVNRYMQKDLIKLGLWTEDFRNRLIRTRGSLQDEKLLPEVPNELRQLYKTAFEIKQKVIIDMAAARGVFIDQSQSLNLFVKSPNNDILTSMHMYAWKQGLKTGMYYLRRDTIAKAQQFTVAPRNFSEHTPSHESGINRQEGDNSVVGAQQQPPKDKEEPMLCRRDDPTCESCSA